MLEIFEVDRPAGSADRSVRGPARLVLAAVIMLGLVGGVVLWKSDRGDHETSLATEADNAPGGGARDGYTEVPDGAGFIGGATDENGTIVYGELPAFIAMAAPEAIADPENVVYFGFVRREDLFPVAFQNVDPYYLNKPMPVYADDLQTEIGVYSRDFGFVRKGDVIPPHAKVELRNPQTGEIVTNQPIMASGG